MRGKDQQQGQVFSYLSPEQRVRQDHPLRPIRAMVDQALRELSLEFAKMYSKAGRPSIPPEQLLRALLLQMLYSVRWAGAKSFQAKDKQDKKDKQDGGPPDDPGNPSVDFHGAQRSNATHQSKSDPDALLARKGAGKEAKLSYCGNLL